MDLFVSGDTDSLSPCFPNSTHFTSHTKSSVIPNTPTSAAIAKCPSASPSMMCQILKRSRSRRVAMVGVSQAPRPSASLRSSRSLEFCEGNFPTLPCPLPPHGLDDGLLADLHLQISKRRSYYCNGWTCYLAEPRPLDSGRPQRLKNERAQIPRNPVPRVNFASRPALPEFLKSFPFLFRLKFEKPHACKRPEQNLR
jgi:hypothetical protein